MDNLSLICSLVNKQFKEYLSRYIDDQDKILLEPLSINSKIIPKINSTNLYINLITTNFKFRSKDKGNYDVEILADETSFQMLIIFPFNLKRRDIGVILKTINQMNDRYGRGSFSYNLETYRIEFKVHILLFGLDFDCIDELLKGFFPFMFSEISYWNKEIKKTK